MGSLPNLKDLVSCETQSLFPPFSRRLGKTNQPEKPSPRHRPVKHVRSVDLTLFHSVTRSQGETKRTQHTASFGVSVDRRIPQVSIRKFELSTQKLTTTETIMNAASPTSTRSARSRSSSTVGHLSHHNINLTSTTTKHRDSMSSSAGASSVRQLIAQVRSTPSKYGPVYSRKVIHRKWASLCLANAMVTSSLVPFLGLQSSISSWWWPSENRRDISPRWFFVSADIGSLLLASLFAIGSLSSLAILLVMKKLGTTKTARVCFVGSAVFFAAHIYPRLYTLIPAYLVMGLCLGPLVGARVVSLMALASKYSYVLTDSEEHEITHSDHTNRRDTIVQKLTRWMQASQDFSLVLCNLAVGLVLKLTYEYSDNVQDSKKAVDSMFRTNDLGMRVCGSGACPVTLTTSPIFNTPTNETDEYALVLPCKSSVCLAAIFTGLSLVSCGSAAFFTDRIISNQDIFEKSSFMKCYKYMTDTFKDPQLQMIGPMGLFIGLCQGFLYADFIKSYVICSLEIFNVASLFVSLGALQGICAATVSLMLQQVKRVYIITIGFMFHCSLMVVLITWTPTNDDPLLLYATGSTWGVCISIWECLTFSLLVSLYKDTWLPAIGHHYFFRYLGVAMMFAFHGIFCNMTKLYFLSAMLFLSALSYSTLEIRIYNRSE